MDTRTLGRPPTFSGRAEDWTMWAFRFETWASLLPPVDEVTVDVILDWGVTRSEEDLVQNEMNTKMANASRGVYYMHAQLIEGGLWRSFAARRGEKD